MTTALRVTPPHVPSLVVGTVAHARHTPVVKRFRHRHYQWLVDADDTPRHRWPLSLLTRFDPGDHLDVRAFLAEHGVELPGDTRVLMLAHARVLGHVFDPLSVYWCLAPDGLVRAVVLEVHNTYGQRHCYLLDLDASGRGQVDKAFYVSPFNDVRGTYTVRLVLDEAHLAASVRLDREGATVLTASVTGTLRPATPRAIASVAARHLLMTQRVTALIRWHGVRLWMRGLHVQPRPQRQTKETVR